MEGIFRLSGSEKRIKELRNTFDSPDRYGKGLDWEGYTVHDAANVLRRYLNQLPEPIVPLELYDRFREPLRGVMSEDPHKIRSPEEMYKIIETYQRLITELPPLNRQLLLYILDLLAVFASKADENRMNSANLAAIFQPGMLSHPQHDMAPGEYRLSQDVLVFLIENQDHFLIGMRGTAADEQTVHDVQKGSPAPASPASKKGGVYRSASAASAGADSLMRQGGVRRNVSVNSRMSRQSNGGPSPSSPALQPLTSTGNGVHRSNTVPSKRIVSSGSRLQKTAHSQSQSQLPSATHTTAPTPSLIDPPIDVRRTPVAENHPQAQTVHPAPTSSNARNEPRTEEPVTSHSPPTQSAVVQKQELLSAPLESPENNVILVTPKSEKNEQSSFFLRATSTSDSEKRPPNKLRKKRLPNSQNPSAQSSSTSLRQVSGQSGEPSPSLPGHDRAANEELAETFRLESIPSGQALNLIPSGAGPSTSNPAISPDTVVPMVQETKATPPACESPKEFPPKNDQRSIGQYDGAEQYALKMQESANSLGSGDVSNEHSEMEPMDEVAVFSGDEDKKKRSIWRMSRKPRDKDDKKDEQGCLSPQSPKKQIGSNNGAEASTTSFGSGGQGWRKSFQTQDRRDMPNMDQLANEPSNGSMSREDKDKKGPMDWLKNKMREAKEEKRGREAGSGKGRTNSEMSGMSDEGRMNTAGESIPEVKQGNGPRDLE